MSNYTSENTEILAMHTEEGFHPNTRMMLLHRHENGDLEYIVGSYFTVKIYDGALGYERADYSWDWGHYFDDVVNAVNYWKREVLPNYGENTCPHCGYEGELKLESTDDYDTDKSYWYRCDSCGRLSKQSFTLIENVPVEG